MTVTLEQAQSVILAHREAEYAKRAEEAKQYLGRFFKFRNSYSGSEKWWLYSRVIEVTELGWLTGISFQRCSDNRVEVREQDMVNLQSGDWQEIDGAEYWKQAAKVLGEMTSRLTPPADV